MLVLKRVKGETLQIGNDVTVDIIDITPGTKDSIVRLGVTAPKEIAIYRREVFEAVKKEQGITPPAPQKPSLFFSREKDESITIGDNVEIVIVDIYPYSNAKVKLGIVAPKEIPIHRKEVYEAISRAKKDEIEQNTKKSRNRVYLLAKELGVKSTDIVRRCKKEGYDINYMSSIEQSLEILIRDWVKQGLTKGENKLTCEGHVLLFEIEVPDKAGNKEIESTAVAIANRADDLHRALGGHGLKIDVVEIYGDVSILETVK